MCVYILAYVNIYDRNLKPLHHFLQDFSQKLKNDMCMRDHVRKYAPLFSVYLWKITSLLIPVMQGHPQPPSAGVYLAEHV